MAVRRSVSQGDFDEAVATNKEAFGMSEEEATAAAIEEFEIQGADLSGVTTSLEARKGIERHPIIALTEKLQAAWSSNAGAAAAVTSLKKFLGSLKSEELLKAVSVSEKEETVSKLVKMLSSNSSDSQLVCDCLYAQSLMLITDQNRSQFYSNGGASAVGAVSKSFPEDDSASVATAKVVEAACTKSEDNKDAFMTENIGDLFGQALLAEGASVDVVRAVSRAVVKLTTADDDRPTVSRAFQNSKALSEKGLHMAFVAVLTKRQKDQEAAAACFAALRKLACNDKLCIELGEAGVVPIALQVFKGCSSQCATAACGLLRQMGGSDALKQQIFQAGGLQVLQRVLEDHSGSAGCMEAGLGLLAALSLRQPEISAAAIKAGLPETVLQVMGVQQQQWVQRQACIALRNLVARCKDQQSAILGLGAEEAIRAAKQAFPAACGDVGSAALRELGCELYNQ